MKTRVSSEHSITKLSTPIAHGVMRFELNKTTLAGITSVPRVIKLAEVSAGTRVIIEDAWIEVLTAFENGTSFDVGDNQFDNSFLQSVAGDNSGVKQEQSTKGVLLATNSTAVLSDFLTLRVHAPTAIPQQTNNGSAVLHVAFKEVLTDHPFSDILSTNSETPSGMGTVPSSGGGGGLVVAGTIGQIQYNDGNGQLAAYTPAEARTHLELELATSDSAAAGGKILKVNSGGITSGDLLSIDSNGEIVSGGPHLMPAGNVGDVQTKGNYGLDSISIANNISATASKLLKVSPTGGTLAAGDLLAIDQNGEIQPGQFYVNAGSGLSLVIKGDQTLNIAATTGLFASTDQANNELEIKLANVAGVEGSYTNADITVDAQGRITSASNGSGGSGGGSGFSSFTVAADSGFPTTISDSETLTIKGNSLKGISTSVSNTSDAVTISLDNTTVTAGTYNSANITVDAQGRITYASDGVGTNSNFFLIKADAASPINNVNVTDTLEIKGNGGISTTLTNHGTNDVITVSLDNTTVTAGSYSNPDITIDAQGRIISAADGSSGSMSFDVQGDDTSVSPVTINSGGKLDFNGGSSYILCKATAGSGSNEADIRVEDFPTGVSSGQYALGTVNIDTSGKIISAHSNVHSVKNNYCTWAITGGVESTLPNGFLGARGLTHSSNLIPGRTGAGKNPFYTHYVYHRHRNPPGPWASPTVKPWTFVTYPDPSDYPIGTTITISFAVPNMPLMQNPYGSNVNSNGDLYWMNALILTPDKTIYDQGNWSGSLYIDNEMYLASNLSSLGTPPTFDAYGSATGVGYGNVLVNQGTANAAHVPVFPLFSNESVTLTVADVIDISAAELNQAFDASLVDFTLEMDTLPRKVAWKVIARGCTNASSDIYQSLYDSELRT